MSKFSVEQVDVIHSVGDAIKAERNSFINAGLDALTEFNVMENAVKGALKSVNHLEEDSAEYKALEQELMSQMQESTRRALGRAIKTMSRICSEYEAK